MSKIGKTILFIYMLISVHANAQRLAIKKDSLSLSELFGQIEKQTPYTVAYGHSHLDINKRIAIPASFENINFKSALSYMLEKSQCAYTITDNHIIIIPRDKSSIYSIFPAEEKQFVFRGIVMDKQTMEALEYATVYLLVR